MKKINFILLIVLISVATKLHAQDSNFGLTTYGGIGFATIESDNAPNYNLNVNSAEVILRYKISKTFGIGTGLGFDTFTGNGFNASGNFYHERTSLRIPLLVSYSYKVSERVEIYGGIGPYGRKILSEDFDTTGLLTDLDTYDGWNFGLQSSFGVSFSLSESSIVGLMINNQGDFTEVESLTDTTTGTPNKQKTKAMYTIGISFGFHF